MGIRTKEQIYQCFLDLLSQKPFDKISVKDIVDSCGINRNTFYYYYNDIYELLEEIFSKEFPEPGSVRRSGLRWILGLSKMMNKAYNNKKIINNICASRSYEYLESYIFKTCRSILAEYIRNVSEDMNLAPQQIDFIISFYQYAITGCLSEWFRTGMQETPDEMLHMFVNIFSVINPTIQISNDNNLK